MVIVWASGFRQICWWPLSALLSPSAVWWLSMKSVLVFIHTGAQGCLITLGGLAHSWQRLPNSTGEVLTSSFLLFPVLQHWGKFSDLFLIVCPTVCTAIWNQLWTFKLNYFPLTEHIIPHMNKLLLLLLVETIIFTIYESNVYPVLTQRLILAEVPLKMRRFPEQTEKGAGDSRSKRPRLHGSIYRTADWAPLVTTQEILH